MLCYSNSDTTYEKETLNYQIIVLWLPLAKKYPLLSLGLESGLPGLAPGTLPIPL